MYRCVNAAPESEISSKVQISQLANLELPEQFIEYERNGWIKILSFHCICVCHVSTRHGLCTVRDVLASISQLSGSVPLTLGKPLTHSPLNTVHHAIFKMFISIVISHLPELFTDVKAA